MFAEAAQDLLTQVQTVAALAEATGMAVGGRDIDPSMSKLPLPAAWVVLTQDRSNDPMTPVNMGGQTLLVTYSVLVYVPYTSQSDLITNQLPLLESVIKAVHGHLTPTGHKWRYEGQRLVLVNPDRLGYEQRYSLPMFV